MPQGTLGFGPTCVSNVVSVWMSCLLLVRVQELVGSGVGLLCRVVGDAFVISLTLVLVRLASFTAPLRSQLCIRPIRPGESACLCLFRLACLFRFGTVSSPRNATASATV